MANARIEYEWSHTANILCIIANCHRDPHSTSEFHPSDFHPLHAKQRPIEKVPISALKQLFVKE